MMSSSTTAHGFKFPAPTPATPTPVGKAVEIYFLDRANEIVKAQIRRVNKQFLQLSSPVPIDRERKCQLRFDDCQLPAETVYCMEQADTGSYLVGIYKIDEFDGLEPRESRVSVRLAATLVCSGVGSPMKIRVTDMSQSGMGIELPRPVAVGEQVAIDLGDGLALGEVRHCRREGNVFRAGVWTDEFVPRSVENRNATKCTSKLSKVFEKVRSALGL